MELFVDTLDVSPYGVNADGTFGGYHFIAETFGEPFQYLPLTIGEKGDFVVGRSGAR